MARKKRKSRKKGGTTKCKIVTVCGKRRRICWGKKGIKSNTPVSGGRRRKSTKKRRTTKKRKGTCKFGRKRDGKCFKSAKSAKAGRAARRRR